MGWGICEVALQIGTRLATGGSGGGSDRYGGRTDFGDEVSINRPVSVPRGTRCEGWRVREDSFGGGRVNRVEGAAGSARRGEAVENVGRAGRWAPGATGDREARESEAGAGGGRVRRPGGRYQERVGRGLWARTPRRGRRGVGWAGPGVGVGPPSRGAGAAPSAARPRPSPRGCASPEMEFPRRRSSPQPGPAPAAGVRQSRPPPSPPPCSVGGRRPPPFARCVPRSLARSLHPPFLALSLHCVATSLSQGRDGDHGGWRRRPASQRRARRRQRWLRRALLTCRRGANRPPVCRKTEPVGLAAAWAFTCVPFF